MDQNKEFPEREIEERNRVLEENQVGEGSEPVEVDEDDRVQYEDPEDENGRPIAETLMIIAIVIIGIILFVIWQRQNHLNRNMNVLYYNQQQIIKQLNANQPKSCGQNCLEWEFEIVPQSSKVHERVN